MLAYLYGVITAGAVNQKLAVDVYGNMVYLYPAFAFARSTMAISADSGHSNSRNLRHIH